MCVKCFCFHFQAFDFPLAKDICHSFRSNRINDSKDSIIPERNWSIESHPFNLKKMAYFYHTSLI